MLLAEHPAPPADHFALETRKNVHSKCPVFTLDQCGRYNFYFVSESLQTVVMALSISASIKTFRKLFKEAL